MVLYTQQWDIRPDKTTEYLEWASSAVPQLLSVPGVVEFRAYRPVTGDRQACVTMEFADLAAWAAWRSDGTVEDVWNEGRAYMDNFNADLWGPSPVVPEPIRPGQ